ncbi:transmembrane protein 134 isoform 2-T2 [Lycaon pictus]
MTPSSCPWRTRARGPNSAESPASGRCTSSAGPGSRWPTRTSSPGCATRTWRTMRMEPSPLRSPMGESAPGIPAERPSAAPSGPSAPSAIAPSAPTMPAAGETLPCLSHLGSVPQNRQLWLSTSVLWVGKGNRRVLGSCHLSHLFCSPATQLDSTPFDPEEPPGGAGLLPAPAAGAECLQRHLLCARLPVVGPGSLPRDLHLLRGQGPPRLPVLLPALLREVSRGAGSSLVSERPQGALFGSAPLRFPLHQGRTLGPASPQPPRKFVQEVCPIPRPGKVAPGLFCALTYSWALELLGWWCFVLIKECT